MCERNENKASEWIQFLMLFLHAPYTPKNGEMSSNFCRIGV